jgi:hypothetical protein
MDPDGPAPELVFLQTKRRATGKCPQSCAALNLSRAAAEEFLEADRSAVGERLRNSIDRQGDQ